MRRLGHYSVILIECWITKRTHHHLLNAFRPEQRAPMQMGTPRFLRRKGQAPERRRIFGPEQTFDDVIDDPTVVLAARRLQCFARDNPERQARRPMLSPE